MDSGMIALLAVAGLLALAVAGALAWAITRPTRTSRPTPVRLGAQAAAPADLPPPEQLGPYRIGHALGRGAMGVVYLAHDAEDRPVALKTLALASEFDAVGLVEARARFFREAETAQRLRHAGIVTVYGAGEDDGLAWIAMEYLPGEPLEAWTRPDRLLPLADALAIVRQAALALDYAHQHQVVHRDIKPANLMYDPATRKIKLTDFGVARLTDANHTRTGLVLGTPAFMSPEQLLGTHIDGLSDLFSLGLLLYQLTTGHLPFNGDSLAELMRAISHDAPKNPETYNPQMPAPLTAIIMKALQKDITTRFQTGAQFALALARLELALKGQ